MKLHDESPGLRKGTEIAQELEWLEAQLRTAIREAELLSQHFRHIAEHARRFSIEIGEQAVAGRMPRSRRNGRTVGVTSSTATTVDRSV